MLTGRWTVCWQNYSVEDLVLSNREIRREKRRKRKKLFRIFLLFFAIVLVTLFIKKDNLKRMKYSLEYDNYVQKYAEEHDMDPLFIHSVIFAESNHNPDAISNRGAVGLMQIMPETGYWISSKMGEKDFGENDLKDPETNIKMGTWLLNYLMDEFNDNEKSVLAAYNAGIGNVQEWLKNYEYSSDGQNLDNIPFRETEEYVEKIRNAYASYKELYPDNAQ